MYQPTVDFMRATSVANPDDSPLTVSVRFLRFQTFGHTAYQKGQFAGFTEKDAQRLVKSGAAHIVDRK